ncbi:hypothetical protein OPQ81_001550 [Rhizoctonia solani]|nr:hypothetical protein OPQ81_001550 [Rhizoctonia solani]
MATSTRSSKTSGKSVFSSFKWDSFDKMFDEAFTPRGSVDTRTRSTAPSPTVAVPPEEGEFDRLWNDARRVRKTTTTRKRVVTRSSDSADTDPEVDEMGQLRPRGKTRSSFTETEHNGIVSLVFELPGIPKSDIKVKFATQKISVAWQKVTVEEKAEGGASHPRARGKEVSANDSNTPCGSFRHHSRGPPRRAPNCHLPSRRHSQMTLT